MGNVIADLVIKVRGEGQDAINEMDKVEGRFSGLASGLRKTGLLMSGLLTTPILAGGMMAFNAASDLNEAISATKTVYGESSQAALDWAKTTADAMGIAQVDSLTAINQYAALGKAMGKTDEQAFQFSKTMVTAASDLASFWNTSPEESLAAIRSGLAGEMEPLKRYGIIIDENAIAQRAMAMTGKDNAAALTLQEKAAARAELIVEGLGDAQGDFARTADGAANAQRRLVARTKDLVAIWGQKLLPIGNAIIKGLLGFTDVMGKVSGKTQTFVLVMAALVAVLGPGVFILGVLLSAFAVLVSPIGLVVLAIAGLLILFPGILSGVKSVIGVLGDLAKLFVAAAGSGEGVKQLISTFPEPLQKVALFVALLGDAFGDLYKAFTTGGLKGLLAALPGELSQIGQAFGALGGAIMDAISGIDWAGLWDIAVEGLKLAAQGGIALGELSLEAGAKLAGKIGEVAGNFVGWLKAQLMGGGAGGGDGTGGPGGGASNGDLLVALGTIALDGLLEFFDLATKAATMAADVATTVIEKLTEAITEAPWGDIWSGVTDLFSDLYTAFETYNYNDLGKLVGEGIKAGIDLVAPTLIGAGQSIIEKVRTGLTGVNWEGLLKWVALIPVAIPLAILLAAEALIPKGKEFIDGLLTGLGLGWDEVIIPWFTALPQTMLDLIVDSASWLIPKGEYVMTGLITGIQNYWDSTVSPWFTDTLPAAIGDFFADALTWLEGPGGDILEGLWTGLDTVWNDTVSPGLSDIIADILLLFVDTLSWLVTAGEGLIQGMWDGASAIWESTLKPGIQNIISSVIQPFANAYNWLLSAGGDAVQGLIDGAVSKIPGLESVIETLKGLFQTIRDLGRSPWPMMIEAGQDAVDGLIVGSKSRLNALDSAIGSVIDSMAAPVDALNRAYGTSGAAQSGGSGDVSRQLARTALQSGNGGGKSTVYNIFALKSDEYVKLLRDAETGAAFAEEFATELGA